jgi:predicted enzyme related to lactoylglutathione lyase
MAFYARLFGWDYEVRTPPEAPSTYAYARIDGQIVAAVGGPPEPSDPSGWATYVSVTSADETAEAVRANGGTVVQEPVDIGPAGRVAHCTDPHGARIGLWQPNLTHGVERVNDHGSWNFSELHSPDPEASIAFYGAVFGWVCDRMEMGPGEDAWLWRVPGYGAFLAEADPEVQAMQDAGAVPDGFSDAVAWLEPYESGDSTQTARWTVTFAVTDADAAVARAVELGASVVTPAFDTPYTRDSVICDPQGAELTLSQYRPPAD